MGVRVGAQWMLFLDLVLHLPIQCLNQWILVRKPFSGSGSFIAWQLSLCIENSFQTKCFDLWNTIGLSEWIKGVSSLKSSLANFICCLNQWILAPKLVSGNYAFHSRESFFVFLLETEWKFGREDSDSVWEPSDVTSFNNVTSFFIFPHSFQV